MDNDLFNEFIDHRRCQLGEIRVLFRQLQKLLGAGRILLKGSDPGLCIRYRSIQLLLLRLVVRQQTVKALGTDPANSKGFVELFDDPVQLIPAFSVLIQLALCFLGGVLLPDL